MRVFDEGTKVPFATMSSITVRTHSRPSSADATASLNSAWFEMSYKPLSVGACDSVGGAETVGLAVVGTDVGAEVGEGMGIDDGMDVAVGDSDGIGDGRALGSSVDVGDTEGIPVGNVLGSTDTVGDGVGNADGPGVGVDGQYPHETSHIPAYEQSGHMYPQYPADARIEHEYPNNVVAVSSSSAHIDSATVGVAIGIDSAAVLGGAEDGRGVGRKLGVDVAVVIVACIHVSAKNAHAPRVQPWRGLIVKCQGSHCLPRALSYRDGESQLDYHIHISYM